MEKRVEWRDKRPEHKKTRCIYVGYDVCIHVYGAYGFSFAQNTLCYAMQCNVIWMSITWMDYALF